MTNIVERSYFRQIGNKVAQIETELEKLSSRVEIGSLYIRFKYQINLNFQKEIQETGLDFYDLVADTGVYNTFTAIQDIYFISREEIFLKMVDEDINLKQHPVNVTL